MPAKDAVALLKEDHKKVRMLLEQLEKTSERGVATRKKLLSQIDQEIKVHTQIEEEIFYPAFRDAAEKKEDRLMYLEALQEHHVVDLILPEVQDEDASTENFAAKVKVLKDLILHHKSEEEKEMFPRAKKLFDREELVELGEQLQARKAQLMGKTRRGR
jgi:hemerythrin superfamily protein